MAQGRKPSFTISFIPGGDDANWQPIGAIWSTKNGKIHTSEITMLPIEALTTGKLRIAVRAYEPKDDQEKGAYAPFPSPIFTPVPQRRATVPEPQSRLLQAPLPAP
jgi:hypothetical protein